MKRQNKYIVGLLVTAASCVAAVWAVDIIVLYVMKSRGMNEDEVAIWQPKILFASFAAVLVAVCVLFDRLGAAKRKVKARTDTTE